MSRLFFGLAACLFAFGLAPGAASADDLVWRLQSQLRFLGYAPGPSDGVMGPGTQRAIDAFLADQGLAPPDADDATPGVTDGADLDATALALRAAIDLRAAQAPTSDATDRALLTAPFRVPPGFYSQPYFRDVYRKLIDIDSDGAPELFAMTVMYAPDMPSDSRPLGALNLFAQGAPRGLSGATGWDELPGMIENPEDFCLHPRTIVLGDYNRDGQMDIFVACHGYDAPPFPGEKNRLLLSQHDGRYRISTPTGDSAFFHGAAAADFDNDGDLDIVLTDNQPNRQLVFLENDGAGGFARARWGTPAALKGQYPMFVVETPDINDDGLFDLFVAGHEHENAPTLAFLNDGSGDFSRASPIRIPPVKGWGTVLDVTVTGEGADRELWVLRTSGGEGSFYQGRLIQRFRPADGASAEVWSTRQLRWTPYIATWNEAGRVFVGNDDGYPALDIDTMP